MPRQLAYAAAVLAVLLAGCSGESRSPAEGPAGSAPPSVTDPRGSSSGASPSDSSSAASDSSAEGEQPEVPPDPVSLPAYFDREFEGGDLRLGTVREQTAAYTSYDASYRGAGLRISGILNVPRGRGPFPAVVLAHGYIDPAVYVSGQGMTRERGYLASQGYLAFHVDYRNHAGSDVDPEAARRLRLGYAVDVITAVQALRESRTLPVDDTRIALMGRSMGGGVVYKALEMAPGLVDAAAVWAPVSSLEADNFNRWIRPDPSRASLVRDVARRYGLPGEQGSARFWREISARTYFDRITEPLLLVQGGSDDTCPPLWARESYRSLRASGVEAELAWYPDEEHAFGPRFVEAMARTVRFFGEHGVAPAGR